MHDTQPYRRQRQAEPQRVRRHSPRTVRRVNWRRRVAFVALVLLAIVIAGAALVMQKAIAFNDAVSSQSAISFRAFGPFGSERVNILLLGYNDESHGGAYLSDSINVVSVDRASGVTTMIPIPRDLWVEGLPEVPQNMKINEAFRIGYYADGLANGAELAAMAVTHVTGLEIDGWISLDFQGFQAMVDAIGGITIENPVAFSYTWAEEDFLAGSFESSFDAGTLQLDGQRALDYARNRYTSVVEESSDFARSVRQQRVLSAIKAKVTGWQMVSEGIALADSLEEHLHTNLSVFDLAILAGNLTGDRRVELAEGTILEATTNTIGQYVLAVIGRRSAGDYLPLHEYIAERLAEPVAPMQTDPLAG
jgi:polyisoprenyl-teichoic acid--peptidoglycan teichoic acid transferase